ncbi:MAG TPA: sulfotransferase [Albidovulum sp.]|uniref:sulfotransferase n=1 Tax=Albidovulum sp. TaxID=1872424 RepID=UPI002C5B3A86|nr:sulfotransferase [Albidovulum sp.]
MILWLYVVIAGVLASEAFLRLPLIPTITRVTATARKSGKVLTSRRISDHWKEAVLPRYSLIIGKGSVIFFLMLCFALLPVALLGFIYPGGFGAWTEELLRPLVILVLCVVSIGYVMFRIRKPAAKGAGSSAEYSATDRFLHRLALGPLAEMLHDIEKARFLKSAPEDSGRHVFVTGLARAGSTILMREIHRTGAFGSLTYADMPFVLAPNTWAQISRKGHEAGEKAERAHGDGILVDTQSPEALDEVYWRVFAGGDYIAPDGLSPHEPDADQIGGYRDLMRLVLKKTGTGRYVSKNNNNILRLPSLAAAMPKAIFLVPLRKPLDHAQSLLAQHQRFLGADAFTRDYMTWLGHHEFGATHRPFRFGSEVTGDPMTIDYWLRLWADTYAALDKAEAGAANVIFVPYEALSADPAVWRAVAERIGVPPEAAAELKPVREKPAGSHDDGLTATAEALHARLAARGFAKLGLAAR